MSFIEFPILWQTTQGDFEITYENYLRVVGMTPLSLRDRAEQESDPELMPTAEDVVPGAMWLARRMAREVGMTPDEMRELTFSCDAVNILTLLWPLSNRDYTQEYILNA